MAMAQVMVVEDDVDLRPALVEAVEELGYDVVAARDAEHALSLLETVVRPCLVLLDYVMPGMGGDGFLDAIEELADAESFSVVLMTGLQTASPRSNKRVVWKILKPFQMEELKGLLQTHCGEPGRKKAEG